MNISTAWLVARRSVSSWSTHECYRLGAAIAFYSLLSLSPFVILALALAAFVLDHGTAQTYLDSEMQSLIGWQGAAAVRGMLEQAQEPTSAAVGSTLGVLTLVIGASAVFAEPRAAMNKIWEAVPDSSGAWEMVETYFLSFGMMLGFGFLLLVSLLLSSGVTMVGKHLETRLHFSESVLTLLPFVLSIAVTAAMFALIFRYVPNVRSPWKVVAAGGVATSAFFTIGKMMIGLYLSKMAIGSGYGAAGSSVVFLVWVYYSAMIFLFGAELTHTLCMVAGHSSSTQLPSKFAALPLPSQAALR